MTLTRATDLAIADCSRSVKVGLKGPRAATWLHECEVLIPPRPNTWLPLAEEGIVARLGESEFLLDEASAGVTPKVTALLLNRPARVYPVLRQDTVIALAGARVNEVLLQTCSVDFSALDWETELVMTSMAGVSAICIPMQAGGAPLVKIWADPTFGPYLWRTLLSVVRDLGGDIGAEPTYHTTVEES